MFRVMMVFQSGSTACTVSRRDLDIDKRCGRLYNSAANGFRFWVNELIGLSSLLASRVCLSICIHGSPVFLQPVCESVRGCCFMG